MVISNHGTFSGLQRASAWSSSPITTRSDPRESGVWATEARGADGAAGRDRLPASNSAGHTSKEAKNGRQRSMIKSYGFDESSAGRLAEYIGRRHSVKRKGPE